MRPYEYAGVVVLCVAAAWVIIGQQLRIECYRVAEFARETPRFMVYQSQLERCEKYNINIPAVVSPDFAP